METCTSQQYHAYLESFTVPDPAQRSLIDEGRVGLIQLPPQQFKYSPDVGYSYEVAVMAEEGTGRRLLFIRIDSWDPQARASGAPIDFCIPIAYEGASARERLTWTLPFEGAWSDTCEEAILVFPLEWAEWFRGLPRGLAFTNPAAESGAFLAFEEREREPIAAFCA